MLQQHVLVSLKRDCQAVLIPDATPITLEKGEDVYIVQALGGFYTVNVRGNLARVDEADADALGFEIKNNDIDGKDISDCDFNEDVVLEKLKTCYDPEIPINIVDLGLIYQCEIQELGDKKYAVKILMTLTAPGCGMGEFLVSDIRKKITSLTVVSEVEIELTFDPPWNQGMMSDAARLATGMY